MTAVSEAARARRYLLGQASDEESATLEQEYFEHPDALDRMAAHEDDLIEDYLGGQLPAAERERFERAYLSTPQHHVRVETVRRLMALAARSAPAAPRKILPFSPRRLMGSAWLALAASMLVVASLAMWLFSPAGSRPASVAGNANQPPATTGSGSAAPAPQTSPRVFSLVISPVAVRGAAESAAASIPAGTDLVAIDLEADVDNRNLTPRRASIRTVGGRDVWQGPVTAAAAPRPGIVGRIEVAPATLAPDDYVVTLVGADASGREMDMSQYFLRVRGR